MSETRSFPLGFVFTPRGLVALWCQRYGYNATADEIQHLLDLLVPKEVQDVAVRFRDAEDERTEADRLQKKREGA